MIFIKISFIDLEKDLAHNLDQDLDLIQKMK